MKIDVHMTTCHRSDVKCRTRTNDSNVKGFNVTEWSPKERLEMSKLSVESVRMFIASLPDEHDVRFSLVDDGSDYYDVFEWLEELDKCDWIEVHRMVKGGSANAVNEYIKTVDDDTDMIVHIEDDHIMFNPNKTDWAMACKEQLDRNIAKVITFRSGLPTQKDDPGLKGGWGPRYSDERCIYFNMMGNAHHIMMYEDYKRMLPLQGNTGGCEAFMNQRLNKYQWTNAELQAEIYAFHAHKLETKLPKVVTTDKLCQTGRGIEYGLKDIDAHLRAGKMIECSYYSPHPTVLKRKIKGYHYADVPVKGTAGSGPKEKTKGSRASGTISPLDR